MEQDSSCVPLPVMHRDIKEVDKMGAGSKLYENRSCGTALARLHMGLYN